jgi:peptidoglycan/xylan/chitin deacetylase (PgdA/CDA1 family)
LRGVVAFCYHGVVRNKIDARLTRNFHTISDVREQVEYFKKQRMLSLSEFASEIECEGPNGGIVTFDDGYANNLDAIELFSAAKLPCAVFVSTDAIRENGMIWTVELSLLILKGSSSRLEILGKVWSLKSDPERELAFQAIRYPMKQMDSGLRRKTLESIRAQFPANHSEYLLEQFPSFRMLTWDQIRQLSANGVEIGSHGVNHELHHSNQTSEVRIDELTQSKFTIEEHLQRSCQFFAYPN